MPDNIELDIIPVLRPSFGQAEIDAVAATLRSGWVGLGPKTAEFEQAFAGYLGAQHCVALNSGTAALHLAAIALNLGPEDEVIVTPITFVSTVHAISYTGATPVFADVDPITLNIDPADVERRITPRTKAIFCVHYAGHPCDMNRLQKIASKAGIPIVEDAAHACGAEYAGAKIGTIGDLTCFSFHAVKNLSTGEGGAISYSDGAYDRRIRSMRWMGISEDTFQRTAKNEIYAWQYNVEALGYKYHMHDISAAIGLVQLGILDANNARRRKLAERYIEDLADLDWLEMPVEKSNDKSAWHLFVVKTDDGDSRDELIGHLKSKRIAPGVHYYPIHLHPHYRPMGVHLPVADVVWRRIISLPLYVGMSDEEQSRVVEAIRSFRA